MRGSSFASFGYVVLCFLFFSYRFRYGCFLCFHGFLKTPHPNPLPGVPGRGDKTLPFFKNPGLDFLLESQFTDSKTWKEMSSIGGVRIKLLKWECL